ncbi:ATP-binding protein [Clostridioides difficile]|uniref:VirB4 family type IV secretion system protein n=1 Tax=Clostridioides difficile TaxID=1496 RepID=UPI00202F9E64|nr:ATP-binding protein [Clostridioides difficile]MCM0739838.1 ATP-binding protein [Clostridioides difficile]HBF2930771.1 ATP-binding protein [Clostridioides difficile]HBF2935756.1 ATP-binding protein [Clostridioides difficile]HBZ0282951.1 ATP-binding protein [Clostridioides difficile]
MFFKKKKEKSTAKIIDFNKDDILNETNLLDKGIPSLKELISPSSFEVDADYIKIGKKYVRSFIMQGFPAQVYVGWLDSIFNYEGETDTTIHIDPTDDKIALEEYTRKITQFEAQLMSEQEKGNIRNITRLRDKIQELYMERSKLERNTDKLFQVQIACNLYSDSLDELNKETQKIDNKLRGRKMYMMPTYLRQDDTYKTVSPYGKSYVEDMFRNFNSGALTSCFPFYNSDIRHEKGVFCGINLSTCSPILIDFYDRSKLKNSNITVIGQPGTGKTFFVSLLTMRSALRGIRTVIIDPESEYGRLTEALGGSRIYLAPDSKECINPFDIEEEDELDENFLPTGIKLVDVKGKIADLLNLIAVMAGGLSGAQTSTVAQLLQELYESFGITKNPKSLYVTEPYFDKNTKEFIHEGRKKTMPIFSDFYNSLSEYAEKNSDMEVMDLVRVLKMFKKGGVYDLFDCYTSSNISNFKNSPIVTFDVSKLEENILRPIGMYVALSWTWEKFGKKDPYINKRIVCDEAWMLVSKNMAGSEYSAKFLETASRRIRKRMGGLLVASQKFTEFVESTQGQAVLTSAETKIFLGQDTTDIDSIQNMFKLSEGEKLFLLRADKGEMLVRIQGESTVVKVLAFDFEKKLIEKRTA